MFAGSSNLVLRNICNSNTRAHYTRTMIVARRSFFRTSVCEERSQPLFQYFGHRQVSGARPRFWSVHLSSSRVQCTANADDTLFKIQVTPSECKYFTCPATGQTENSPQG